MKYFVLFEPSNKTTSNNILRLALLFREDLQRKIDELDSGFPFDEAEEILSDLLIDSRQPDYMSKNDYDCVREYYGFFVVRIDDETARSFEKLLSMTFQAVG